MYLGAVVVLILAAFAVNKFGNREDGILMLRLPSSLMVVVGMFHQGMVTCGVSLIRIATSSTDTIVGTVGIGLGVLSTLGVLLAMTVRLACKIEHREQKEKPLALESSVPGLSRLLKLTVWDKHWVDDGTCPGYKRRYLWLLDDLRLPWWAAVELSSGLVQGGILGVRLNDVDACRKQRIAMLVHCVVMFLLAVALRPCGSLLGNAFLIAAKFCGTMVAVFIMVHTQTTNSSFATGASVVTSIFAFLSTIQAVCQLVAAVVLGSRSVVPALRTALRKFLAEEKDLAVKNCGHIRVDEEDELMRELLSKAEVTDEDVFMKLLLEQSPAARSEAGELTTKLELSGSVLPDADYFLNGLLSDVVPVAVLAPIETAASQSSETEGASSSLALKVDADDFLNDLLSGLVVLAPAETTAASHPLPAPETNPFMKIEDKPKVNPFAQEAAISSTGELHDALRRSSLGQFQSSGRRETATVDTNRRKRAGTSALATRNPSFRLRTVSIQHMTLPPPPAPPSESDEGDPEREHLGGFDTDFDDLLTPNADKKQVKSMLDMV